MTLNISLPPQTEAKLRECAAAAGKDITTFVMETIEEKLGTNGNGAHRNPVQGSNEWFRKFNEWVSSHPQRQFFADDSRDVIYSQEPD